MNRSKVGAVGVLAAAAVLVVTNRSDLPIAARAVRHAQPASLAAGFVLVVLALYNVAGFHAAAQRAFGEPATATQLLLAVSGAGFLNAAVKSGGMAGISVLVSNARRRGRSSGPVVAAYMLVNVLGHLAFACVLIIGFAFLAVDGRLTLVDVSAAVAFTVISVVQFAALAAALRSRDAVRRLYSFPQRLRRRLATMMRRQARTTGDRTPGGSADPGVESVSDTTHQHADELFDAVQQLRSAPGRARVAFVHALLVEVIGVAELWCVLRAVHAGARLTVAVVAYAVSVLFAIVSVLPAGLGFVEVGLAACLISNGLPHSTAIAVVVLYRVLELWLPAAIGIVSLRWLARRVPTA